MGRGFTKHNNSGKRGTMNCPCKDCLVRPACTMRCNHQKMYRYRMPFIILGINFGIFSIASILLATLSNLPKYEHIMQYFGFMFAGIFTLFIVLILTSELILDYILRRYP